MNQMAEITPETSFLLSQEQENGKWSRLTSTNKIYVFLNPSIKTRFGRSASHFAEGLRSDLWAIVSEYCVLESFLAWET